jgi:hypothetical protein
VAHAAPSIPDPRAAPQLAGACSLVCYTAPNAPAPHTRGRGHVPQDIVPGSQTQP